MNHVKPIMIVKYINGSIRVPKSGCYTDGGDVKYCKTFIFYFFDWWKLSEGHIYCLLNEDVSKDSILWPESTCQNNQLKRHCKRIDTGF